MLDKVFSVCEALFHKSYSSQMSCEVVPTSHIAQLENSGSRIQKSKVIPLRQGPSDQGK